MEEASDLPDAGLHRQQIRIQGQTRPLQRI